MQRGCQRNNRQPTAQRLRSEGAVPWRAPVTYRALCCILRVCRLVKDEGAGRGPRSAVPEKLTLDLTVRTSHHHGTAGWGLGSSVQFREVRAVLKGVSGNFIE